MSTTFRATILGIVLSLISGMGTLIALGIITFTSGGKPPFHELLPYFGWVLLPGLILSAITACLPISRSYKKAITSGLILPTIASCLYVGLG